MPQANKPWFVYLVRCRDGTIYTGITNDVDTRLKKHNQGRGAKYTAQRRPVALLYTETYPDQNSARKREFQLKGWTKQKKEALAAGFAQLRSE